MNAVAAVEPCECLPCSMHCGTTDSLVPVAVTVSAKVWSASPNKILMGSPTITVIWNLTNVWDSANWGGLTVTKIDIVFDCGPGTFDTHLGPFSKIVVPTTPGDPLVGEDQSFPIAPYADCYRYNLLVWLQGQETPQRVFAIDPQIDNLAPPGACG